MNPPSVESDRRVAVVLGLFALPVFLAGASALLYWRDASEFAMIGFGLDIGHPAGSPTFAMLTKALDVLPLGSTAFKPVIVNILASCAAMSALAWLVLRWSAPWGVDDRVRYATAAWIAAAYGFSPALFDWVVVPEVYATQVLALALIGICALEYRRGGDRRYAFAGALVLGLSCGVHMGNILLAPGIAVVFFAAASSRIAWRDAAVFIAFAGVGFAVFAYLPARSAADPPFDQGNPEFWAAFLSHVTGARYSGVIHSFPWPRVLYDLRALVAHVPEQVGILASIFAAFGFMDLVRRRPAIAAGLVLMAAGHLYLYIKDWHRAFGYIPLFAAIAILAAIGWLRLLLRMGAAARWHRAAALTALLAVWTWSAWTVRAVAGHSAADHDLAQRHARGILDSMPEGSIYVSFVDPDSYTVFYTQAVERYREDVTHIQRAFLHHPDYLARRYPALPLANYDPDRDDDAERMLLATRAPAVFWDYGWEDMRYFDPAHLAPHSFVYRLDPQTADADLPLAAEKRWIRTMSPRIRLFPNDFTAQEVYTRFYSMLSKYHFDRGRPAQARARLEQGLAIDPDAAALHTQSAAISASEGDWERAWREVETATRLEPYGVDHWNTMALVARRLGRTGEMLEAYRRSRSLNRHQAALVPYAEALLEREEFREAEAVARDAATGVTSDRDRSRVARVRAASLAGLGRCADALEVLDREGGGDGAVDPVRAYCGRAARP